VIAQTVQDAECCECGRFEILNYIFKITVIFTVIDTLIAKSSHFLTISSNKGAKQNAVHTSMPSTPAKQQKTH